MTENEELLNLLIDIQKRAKERAEELRMEREKSKLRRKEVVQK